MVLKDFRVLFVLICSFAACQSQDESRQIQVNENAGIVRDIDDFFEGTVDSSSTKGPRTITRNILEDRNGHIWLATWDGIIGYDGHLFTNYTNTHKLRRYRTFCILEDLSGKIWFGTIGAGVYIFDGSKFTNITSDQGLVNNSVGCLMEDSNGNIWIGTQGGISIYDGNSFKNYTEDNGLASNDINSIAELDGGIFWIGSRGSACSFDGEKFQLLQPDSTSTPFHNIRSIIKDKTGNIWLGGDSGLWRYQTPRSDFHQIKEQFVGYIYEDRSGNIWTSSEATHRLDWALSKFDISDIEKGSMSPTVILQEENMFFGINEDTKGGIWLGSLNGAYRYDGSEFDYFDK